MTRPLASLQPKTEISKQFTGKLASYLSTTAFRMLSIQLYKPLEIFYQKIEVTQNF